MHFSKRTKEKSPYYDPLRTRSNRILSSNSRTSNSVKSRSRSQGISSSSICIHKQVQENPEQPMSLANLLDKYLGVGGKHTELHSEMNSVIDSKKREIQTLRVYRDQLKMIKELPNIKNQKIQLNLLKEKANVEGEIVEERNRMVSMINEMAKEEEDILRYCHWVIDNFNSESVVDLEEEKNILEQNLQFEVDYALRQLAKTKNKNACEVKKMQDEIMSLRVQIKNKENSLQQLKSKICSLHIKLNQRNKILLPRRQTLLSSEREMKQLALRYIYMGNNSIEGHSTSVPKEFQLKKLIIFKKKKDSLGIMGVYENDREQKINQTLQKGMKSLDEFMIEDLLSLKLYYGYRIMGIEYRKKSSSQIITKQFGECLYSMEHKFLNFVNKEVQNVTPVWQSENMIGVGIEFNEKVRSVEKEQRAHRISSRPLLSQVQQEYCQ